MSILAGLLVPSIIGQVLGIIEKVVDGTVKNVEEARQLKAELATKLLAAESELTKATASVVVAEAQGESWIQRIWRPLLMFLLMGLIIWIHVVVPMIGVITGLDGARLLPPGVSVDRIYSLIEMGVMGYIGGRSLEKITKTIKGS